MDRTTLLAALRRHWEYAATDQEIAHEIYHDDAVLEFPQSQERFEGKESFKAWRSVYPAAIEFKIRRLTGQLGTRSHPRRVRPLSSATLSGLVLAPLWMYGDC
jgi:hypothetical protein